MKQFSLVLFLHILAITGYAQVNSANDAFSKYHSGDYQSAIKLYRAKLARKVTMYDQFMLGLCYIELDSTALAKQEFEKVIASKDEHFLDNIKVDCCARVAKLYLNEKDYRKALYYYQLYAAIFEKAKFADVNWARFHFFNANDQARCYTALGLTDSAIMVMTPYMFYTYKALTQLMFVSPNYSNPKDSLQHDSVSRFYISLLQKRYSNRRIKAEFEKAERSFMFAEDRRPVDQYGFIWENIKCSVDIYGVHVVFLEQGIGDKEEKLLKEIQTPFYTKAYQLEQFHQLPVCQMVRAL